MQIFAYLGLLCPGVKRRKKMNVPPGKSVCADELMVTKETVEDEPTTSFSRPENEMVFDDHSSDDIDFDELAKEDQKEKQFMDFLEGKASEPNYYKFASVVREIGTFVVFLYEGELYPGQIVGFDDKEVTVNSMEKSLKMWKWPSKRDELTYPWTDVLGSIQPPKQVSKRAIFSVPELTNVYD